MSLSARDRLVFDSMLPANADPLLPFGVCDTDIDLVVREFERAASREIRAALRIALAAATWIAPLLVGARPPLGRHAPDVRERALAAMAASRVGPLRELVVLLKLVTALSYGADARVRERVGYARGRPR